MDNDSSYSALATVGTQHKSGRPSLTQDGGACRKQMAKSKITFFFSGIFGGVLKKIRLSLVLPCEFCALYVD